MQNSMVVFIASVLRWKYSLWASLVQKMKIVSFSFQKIKTVSWSWNLEPRLIWIFKIWRWFSFYSFLDWKYSFWVNLAQKIKIVSLSWNLVPRLFWIIKIWRWWSFFCFRPSFASFVHKIHLAFWCYLMNLPVVYLQKLEASGFFYLNIYVFWIHKFPAQEEYWESWTFYWLYVSSQDQGKSSLRWFSTQAFFWQYCIATVQWQSDITIQLVSYWFFTTIDTF